MVLTTFWLSQPLKSQVQIFFLILAQVVAFTANYYLSLHLVLWGCFVVYKLPLPQDLCAQIVGTSAPDKCTGSITVSAAALILIRILSYNS